MHYKITKTSLLDPVKVAAGGVNIQWIDRTLWLPSYFEKLGNIWFYSTRILPLFTGHMRRDLFQLPDMEDVIVFGPEEKIKSDWCGNKWGVELSLSGS